MRRQHKWKQFDEDVPRNTHEVASQCSTTHEHGRRFRVMCPHKYVDIIAKNDANVSKEQRTRPTAGQVDQEMRLLGALAETLGEFSTW